MELNNAGNTVNGITSKIPKISLLSQKSALAYYLGLLVFLLLIAIIIPLIILAIISLPFVLIYFIFRYRHLRYLAKLHHQKISIDENKK
jgi:hypothetical protein